MNLDRDNTRRGCGGLRFARSGRDRRDTHGTCNCLPAEQLRSTHNTAIYSGDTGPTTDRFKDNTANIPSPIVKDNKIFFSAGYGRGGGLVQVSQQAGEWKVEEIYFERDLNNKHGGVIWVGDYLFGDQDSSGRPFCAEAQTGKTVWRKGRDGDRQGLSRHHLCGRPFILPL